MVEMVKMFEFTINVHIIFILALAILMIRNLTILFFEENFIKLAKKIRFPTAMLHSLIAINFFTGILLMSFPIAYNLPIDSNFYIMSFIMIAITLFIMIAEIKRYKRIRVIKSTETKLQQEFIKFAKKIYIIDLILIVSIFLIYKII